MTRDLRPANVTLRMSRELRDGLHVAANEAGCSLNSFAVQILAAAAGDPAKFHRARPKGPREINPDDIERDKQGWPLSHKLRWEHGAARQAYIRHLGEKMGSAEGGKIIRKIETDDPALFMRWYAEQKSA
jgi:hypothetical protein